MNKEFLKRLTQAHSWLGLIISGLLFIVFFAGSISLFRDEIDQWSMQPHIELSEKSPLPISQIMESAIKGLPFDAKEHLTLIAPTERSPYYKAYIDIHHEPGENDYVGLFIDPNTGEKVSHINKFKLAKFIYDLHTDLNIPAGTYVVGVVTLLFFFALISGIFIHARKLISNFFKYRSEENPRSKLLDMHNVVGVISLPFTLMYTISGLIFNLAIIYQIVFALVLYKGDRQALLDDGGYKVVKAEWVDKAWNKPAIDALYEQTRDKYNVAPRVIRAYNYGDESAVLHFFVSPKNSLTSNYEVAFNLKDNSVYFKRDLETPNVLRTGLSTVSKLHFGDYAGLDLRILYFILGMGVCGLIVTGNLLWIEKRSRQRNQSPKTLAFVNNFTLWSTGGVIIATAMAFLVERVIPLDIQSRADYMINSFIVMLVLVALLLIFNRNKKWFLGWLLKASAFIVITVILCDWIMFYNEIITLTDQGVTSIIGTQVGLAIVATVLIFAGNKLTKNNDVEYVKNTSDLYLETLETK